MSGLDDVKALADALEAAAHEFESSDPSVLVQSLYDCFEVEETLRAVALRLRGLLEQRLDPRFEGPLLGQDGGRLVVKWAESAKSLDAQAVKQVLCRHMATACLKLNSARIPEAMEADPGLAADLDGLVQRTQVRQFRRQTGLILPGFAPATRAGTEAVGRTDGSG